ATVRTGAAARRPRGGKRRGGATGPQTLPRPGRPGEPVGASGATSVTSQGLPGRPRGRAAAHLVPTQYGCCRSFLAPRRLFFVARRQGNLEREGYSDSRNSMQVGSRGRRGGIGFQAQGLQPLGLIVSERRAPFGIIKERSVSDRFIPA